MMEGGTAVHPGLHEVSRAAIGSSAEATVEPEAKSRRSSKAGVMVLYRNEQEMPERCFVKKWIGVQGRAPDELVDRVICVLLLGIPMQHLLLRISLCGESTTNLKTCFTMHTTLASSNTNSNET